MIVVGLFISQYFKYQSVVGLRIGLIKIISLMFFGSAAFSALLSCAINDMIKMLSKLLRSGWLTAVRY